MARKARAGAVKHIGDAKKNKNDEFYTQLVDIEKELKHYQHHFTGKTVLCNCDDPRVSKFFHYFSYNFEKLGLKKLIATCYKNRQLDLFSWQSPESVDKAIYITYEGDKKGKRIPSVEDMEIKHFKGDGDFRSEECIELLKQADIVVTNPPFSLFREFVKQLFDYEKRFLIIGAWNAITTKEIFRYFMENRLWIGENSNRQISGFIVPDHYKLYGGEAKIDDEGNRIVSSNNNCWFTNLDLSKRHEELILYKKYTQKEYPMYSNCEAIEVSKVKEIPLDYEGVMGVPITFLNKYNPNQFEILGMDDHNLKYPDWRGRGPDLNGKAIYRRIMIKHKKEEEE